jgi:hypothetical protein
MRKVKLALVPAVVAVSQVLGTATAHGFFRIH